MTRLIGSAGFPGHQILKAGRALAMATGCLMSTAPVVLGQAVTEASIVGLVTDESGAILPGVTVTASSPALQLREVVEVTDSRGEYRIAALPIGTYTVTYALSGFQRAARDGV